MIEKFGTDPAHPIAQAVRAGDWLYVSGQASTDPATGAFVRGTFDEEFARSVANLRRVLGAAGGSYEQIVRIGAFVRDEEMLPRFNELYLREFAHPRPARTTIGLSIRFLKFEIECVAFLG